MLKCYISVREHNTKVADFVDVRFSNGPLVPWDRNDVYDNDGRGSLHPLFAVNVCSPALFL